MSISKHVEADGSAPTSAALGSEPQEVALSLSDLLKVLWGERWLIAIVTAVVTAIALIASLVIEKQYDASVVISPVSDDSSSSRLGGIGALVSQFGGLASVAGLSVSGNERKAESLAILQSEALTNRFIASNNLLPVLYADDWDAGARKWKVSDARKVPTLWKANQYFKKHVRKVTTDTKTGLSTLTITWNDPRLAAKWANDLVALGNDSIRGRTIQEGERNVAYLNEQLKKSNLVAVQNSVSSLLEAEIKKIMLARGSNEYAFKVIDAAVQPEKATFPNPVVWTVLGAMLGFVAAAALALARARRSPGTPA
jgi:uncharacterized protein involved in exopolysaccharide biosynthesis